MEKEGRRYVQRDILDLVGLSKCTGKDNEAQKEDPGEEFREARVDYQELRPAPPLLRGQHPRACPSWFGLRELWVLNILVVNISISISIQFRSRGVGRWVSGGQRGLFA